MGLRNPWNKPHVPDDIPLLSLSEIREFFARRTWTRPNDWDAINAIDPMDDIRRRDLSTWIHGYHAGTHK